jgi:hypothetical protein
MLERRRITRTRIFAPAIVIPSRLSLACECTVRDITCFEARLEFRKTAVVPYVFDLTFDSARTLKALRLAKEAQSQNEALPTEQRPTRRKKIIAL